MSVVGCTKSFCLKVWSKIVDHLAGFVACVIIVVFCTLCVTFWGWMKTKHQLNLYGWIWLIALLVLSFLTVIVLWVAFDYFTRIKDPKDVRNVLSKWWRHCTDQNRQQNEFTLYFSDIDKKEGLKKGSAKKYLREIVIKKDVWGVVREGSKTLTVKRKEFTVTIGEDGTPTS